MNRPTGVPRASRAVAAGLVSWALLATTAPSAAAQDRPAEPDSSGLPAALLGEWVGEGELFGRPAKFSMAWRTALDGRFLELAFENAFPDSGGGSTVVLRATAFYRIAPPHDGVWMDTRGEILTLRAEIGDSALVTRWTSPTEEGRTTYRLLGPERLEVVDEVIADGSPRVFARAVYARIGDATPGG